MKIYYMNGAGNDFMVMDARDDESADFSAMARKLCKLENADGFIALGKSDTADFRLHFYNADGTRGEMCGNGVRCLCRFAYDRGIAGPEMTVHTDAGPVSAWRIDADWYRVRLNLPSVLDLNRKADIAYAELGDPGVPHAVVQYEGDLWGDADKLLEEMRSLRYDPAFPKGANVNYYQILSQGEARILTFERGVEGYTLACGTGTGSVACTMLRRGLLTGNVLTAHNPGGTLKITLGEENGAICSILLEGPTQVVSVYEL